MNEGWCLLSDVSTWEENCNHIGCVAVSLVSLCFAAIQLTYRFLQIILFVPLVPGNTKSREGRSFTPPINLPSVGFHGHLRSYSQKASNASDAWSIDNHLSSTSFHH